MGNEIHNQFFMNAEINPSVSRAQRQEVREAVADYDGPVTRVPARRPETKIDAVLTKIIKTRGKQDMCIVVEEKSGRETAITVDARFKPFFAKAKTGTRYRFDVTKINLHNGFDKGDFFRDKNRGYITDYALNREPGKLGARPKAKQRAGMPAVNGRDCDPEP